MCTGPDQTSNTLGRVTPASADPTRDHAKPSVIRREGHRAPAVVVAIVAAVGVWVMWRFFVTTQRGQTLDQAAFDGSRYGRTTLWQVAEPVLDVISLPFIAIVLVAAMLLAVLQRRVVLAVQVAVLMGGANLTTQLLKHVVFDRPDLGVGDTLDNALPSGHTTAAASVSAALLFVVPRRLRPLAAVVGVAYTCATGISTLVGRWHRPSDAVAAMLVVLAWAGLASAIGSHGRAVRGPERPRGTVLVVVGLLLAGVLAGLGTALSLRESLGGVDGGLTSSREMTIAYASGSLGVVAVVCVAFALLLLLRQAAEPRVVEVAPRPSATWPTGGPAAGPPR